MGANLTIKIASPVGPGGVTAVIDGPVQRRSWGATFGCHRMSWRQWVQRESRWGNCELIGSANGNRTRCPIVSLGLVRTISFILCLARMLHHRQFQPCFHMVMTRWWRDATATPDLRWASRGKSSGGGLWTSCALPPTLPAGARKCPQHQHVVASSEHRISFVLKTKVAWLCDLQISDAHAQILNTFGQRADSAFFPCETR